MKNLPIGIQSLPEIRDNNCVYVDKTELVHRLVTKGKYYFLSRPRRFGKSLLVSTIKELFEGNRALFDGLWVENRWDWDKKHPVLRFSFESMEYPQRGLETVLHEELARYAETFGIDIGTGSYKGQFAILIRELAAKHGQVVLLVDEYDKPIIDFLAPHNMPTAKANRDILREFYGVLKSSDEYLRLVLITGISKFSKVSLFSHLNNLSDITIHPDYSAICGYTQVELEHSFAEHLDAVADALPISRPELLDAMQRWYNGYSWDGRVKLYNPFGVLNFLDKRTFKNYWFASGNPNFLIEQMRVQSWYEVENVVVSDITLERFDLENLELSALLFQTGYLTIKHLDVMNGDMIMDYPNREVRESMYQVLISDLAANAARPHTGMTILDIRKAFIARDLGQVRTILNSLLTDLPHEVFDKKSEGLYHGLIHLIFKYLGMYADSEVHSARGRADAVVQTDTDVYLFEFKFNKTAQAALEQILKGDYAAKFRATGKPITAIGVNFDPALREISEWVEEVV